MDVKVTTFSEEFSSKNDERQIYEVEIDGKRVFSAYDGEVEDNNLSRNFSSVFNIPEMLKKVHEAGLAGQDLNFECVEKEEF